MVNTSTNTTITRRFGEGKAVEFEAHHQVIIPVKIMDSAEQLIINIFYNLHVSYLRKQQQLGLPWISAWWQGLWGWQRSRGGLMALMAEWRWSAAMGGMDPSVNTFLGTASSSKVEKKIKWTFPTIRCHGRNGLIYQYTRRGIWKSKDFLVFGIFSRHQPRPGQLWFMMMGCKNQSHGLRWKSFLIASYIIAWPTVFVLCQL